MPAIVRDNAADPSDEEDLRAMAHSDVGVGQRELHAMSEALNQALTRARRDTASPMEDLLTKAPSPATTDTRGHPRPLPQEPNKPPP